MNIIELAIAAQLIDHRDTAESLPADFVQSLNEFAALVRQQTLEELAEQQEPYAWMAVGGTIWRHKTTEDDVPLYTAPQPRRQPLTDLLIATVYWGATGQSLRPQDNALVHKFARALEAAHGITGETK
jgi:hypothetical protein